MYIFALTSNPRHTITIGASVFESAAWQAAYVLNGPVTYVGRAR